MSMVIILNFLFIVAVAIFEHKLTKADDHTKKRTLGRLVLLCIILSGAINSYLSLVQDNENNIMQTTILSNSQVIADLKNESDVNTKKIHRILQAITNANYKYDSINNKIVPTTIEGHNIITSSTISPGANVQIGDGGEMNINR